MTIQTMIGKAQLFKCKSWLKNRRKGTDDYTSRDNDDSDNGNDTDSDDD